MGEVIGVDMTEPISREDMRVIWDAFNEHQILVFRDQAFDDESQIRFSRNFGTLETMEAHAANRRKPVVERVPDQGVSEAQASGDAGDLAEDAFEHCLVQDVQQVASTAAGQPGKDVEVELAPEDRRRNERGLASLGQPCHPLADDRARAGRDAEASIRLLEKVGFTREGYARKYLCIDGRWQDHLLYGLVRDDPRR